MKTLGITVFVLVALFVSAILPAQEDLQYIVITHPDNPVGWVGAEDLSEMFLTKRKTWPDGVVVTPVDLKSGSSIRRAFSDQIHRKSVNAVESFINQQIFSGRAKPPLVVGTDEEVIAFVSANRGAVGYVSRSADLSSVRNFPIAMSPIRISEVKPKYTAGATRMKIHGNVILEVLIDTKGNVADITPIEELPMGLTRSAMDAVRLWKYEPATLGGEPVETTIRVTLRF